MGKRRRSEREKREGGEEERSRGRRRAEEGEIVLGLAIGNIALTHKRQMNEWNEL